MELCHPRERCRFEEQRVCKGELFVQPELHRRLRAEQRRCMGRIIGVDTGSFAHAPANEFARLLVQRLPSQLCACRGETDE